MLSKAVFLDKDGTLIENVPYNVEPAKIRPADGALEAARLLHNAGFKIFVISNQSGVARGYFEEAALEGVKARLHQLLESVQVPLAGFYYCPHHPDGKINRYALACFCRKPNPGMLFQAAREHQLNLADSWMIGDILDDIEAGRRADCRTILIDNGNETIWRKTPLRHPNYIVKNMAEAAEAILRLEERSVSGISPQPLPVTTQLNRVKVRQIVFDRNQGVSQPIDKGNYGRKPAASD